ncbi:glycoside hydrolase family 16 protein [Lentithecium fluviatile CBS 122367]|uniref:Glycoside hydrolase family 16 protein n=1 Tax=Lentithecium fluviatile CBS 122367 TaxID=1168545 RepID=A0A6G1ILG7_9PLEO|nr:glycoside hydrolase family 16 protein [Lentithecium fluviatile CBS 122367]
MVRHTFAAALAAAAFAGSAFAQKGSRASHCPADAPCGGLYNDCGVGAFCLGGCDVTTSHSIDSCVPGPVCKSGKYPLSSLDDVQSIDKYLGDNSKINWQLQGQPVFWDDKMVLTMAEGTSGTLIASTFYVWYGKICANLRTSQGQGVVTAFIMMSDVKDEIDFEFVGTDINNAQTNWYSQGITDYTQMKKLPVDGDTVSESHEYCIDWTEDELTWSIDGTGKRTTKKSETWNSTSNRFDYPQTPSRIMISLWPAGLSSNGEGTIEWAGGLIDWQSKYMQNNMYVAVVSDVSVECYDPPSGITKKGSKVYKYTDAKNPTNNTIQITDDYIVLASLENTGENPGDASKSSSTSTGPKPTKTAAQVPGGNPGGGLRGDTTTTASGSNPSETSGSGSGASTTTGSGGQSFDQGTTNTGAGVVVEPGLGRVGGSALAIVVAVLGLLVL